ncbi:MAG: macro domain-containing protein [Elusimicrobiaceae bacterium]|nr:macro domain-containing protein [Elusimicrobiaceae bacterium]
METIINKTRLECVTGNIVRETTDAIVNAANEELSGGGGVDGAIHYSGGPAIAEECQAIIDSIGRLEPGCCALTSGGKLKARFVIHTVGPAWQGGKAGEEEVLRRAHRNSLIMAAEKELASIAFPAISTGTFRYPKIRAALAAMDETVTFLRQDSRLALVRFVLIDDSTRRMYEDAVHLCGG